MDTQVGKVGHFGRQSLLQEQQDGIDDLDRLCGWRGPYQELEAAHLGQRRWQHPEWVVGKEVREQSS